MSETTPDAGWHSPLVTAAAGAVTALTLAAGLGLLALGRSFFWVAFPVGFGGLMPLAVGLARWYESRTDRSGEPAGVSADETDRALAALRERYVRGEIDEATFEERVDALLRTEDVATAREHEARRTREGTGSERDHEPERASERD